MFHVVYPTSIYAAYIRTIGISVTGTRPQHMHTVNKPTFGFAPITLCSVPPNCVRSDRFLASKRMFSTAGSQSYRIRRHFGTSILVYRVFQGKSSVDVAFCPTNFFRKAPPMSRMWLWRQFRNTYVFPSGFGVEYGSFNVDLSLSSDTTDWCMSRDHCAEPVCPRLA